MEENAVSNGVIEIESPKKNIKHVKRKQSFKDSYSQEFDGIIRRLSQGCHYAFYSTCRTDFTVCYGGINDIKKHINTDKHKLSSVSILANHKINNFFTSDEILDVTRAETLFTEFIIEHSLPLSVADHAGFLFRKMFPDSKIVHRYRSAIFS